MSSLAFNTTSKNPFCKVCLDAGKEDTNHWVKNEKGKVICPTLLALLCKYCSKKGHTVSYCPVLAKNKKREAFFEKKQAFSKKENNKNSKINKNKNNTVFNRFQLLDSSDDEEKEKEEEPASPVNTPPPSSLLKKPTYASILSNVQEKVSINVMPVSVPVSVVASAPTYIPVLPLKRKLWSEYNTDSDDDDDE
jgi:hypothetical protein